MKAPGKEVGFFRLSAQGGLLDNITVDQRLVGSERVSSVVIQEDYSRWRGEHMQ